MASEDLKVLEEKIEELLKFCETLSRENQVLLTQHQNWTSERAKLVEQKELARSKVEAMISRLKALEQDA